MTEPRPTSQIPGPFGGVFGNVSDVREDTPNFYCRLARDYGFVARYRLGLDHFILLSHPLDIKRILVDNAKNYSKNVLAFKSLRVAFGDGLVTSEGETWQRHRAMIQPSFKGKALQGFCEKFVAATASMVDAWDKRPKQNGSIDIAAELSALTFRIVCSTLLGEQVDQAATHRLGETPTIFNRYVDSQVSSIFPIPFHWRTPGNERMREALRVFDETVYAIIKHAREHPDYAPTSLVSMMLKAQEAGTTLTDRELRDEIVTIMIAGHETTANALAWAFYLLSQHPHIERRLRTELNTVLAGRTPTYQDLKHLPYLHNVLQESMRIFPPVHAIPRLAVADDVLGGYRIPAGTTVFVGLYTVHHHPEFWPNPEGFDPDRFEGRTATTDIEKYSYLPFGAGPRQCIGQVFAMLEAQLIMATVLQRYRLDLVPGHVVTPEPLVTIRPKTGILMHLTRPDQAATLKAAV